MSLIIQLQKMTQPKPSIKKEHKKKKKKPGACKQLSHSFRALNGYVGNFRVSGALFDIFAIYFIENIGKSTFPWSRVKQCWCLLLYVYPTSVMNVLFPLIHRHLLFLRFIHFPLRFPASLKIVSIIGMNYAYYILSFVMGFSAAFIRVCV